MSRLKEMEEMARGIGGAIRHSLPEWAGFCLLIFDYGQQGDLTYISTAEREQLMKALRETADIIEKGLHNSSKALS